jgi:type IV pilus assembly protein PilC
MATTTKKVEKTYTFAYEGTDRRGQKIKGETTGKSQALAKAQLQKQGIKVNKISQKSNFSFGGGGKKINPMDVAIFTRQLATMMKAGVPLVQAFDIVAEGLDNPSMKKVVLQLKTDVEGGNSLASALVKHPLLFDSLFCSLVSSGEQSGALEQMLDRVAQYKEKSELLKQKIKKAMKYPMTVIIVAFIVTVILLLKVVPVFQDLFSSFGAELPAFTMMVINLSKWMQSNWIIFIGGIIGLAYGLMYLKRTNQQFADQIDRQMLKMPIIGDLTFKSTIARFCRTLATTFSAGVPLIEALESCAGAAGNVVYRDAILKIRNDVATGQQLGFAMRQTGLFPSMSLQMVAIGEESGALDAMLDKVASYYENEVDNAVDGLTSMMEPLIMAVLGVLVGGLVVAMYLPIFQLGSVV